MKPRQKQQSEFIAGKKIKKDAFDLPDDTRSTDHMSPVFSFSDTCPNHFRLDDWTKKEIKQLIDQLRLYSGMKWSDLRKIKGFGPVDPSTFSKKLPKTISPEVKIYECRINGKMRLFGHRVKNTYHIIWFDRNHEVYPMS